MRIAESLLLRDFLPFISEGKDAQGRHHNIHGEQERIDIVAYGFVLHALADCIAEKPAATVIEAGSSAKKAAAGDRSRGLADGAGSIFGFIFIDTGNRLRFIPGGDAFGKSLPGMLQHRNVQGIAKKPYLPPDAVSRGIARPVHRKDDK